MLELFQPMGRVRALELEQMVSRHAPRVVSPLPDDPPNEELAEDGSYVAVRKFRLEDIELILRGRKGRPLTPGQVCYRMGTSNSENVGGDLEKLFDAGKVKRKPAKDKRGNMTFEYWIDR